MPGQSKLLTYILPDPSEEQRIIIADFRNGNNVVINAVAGSGKTTLLLHIVRDNPKLRFVLLTYNKDLQTDTLKRCKSLGLGNVNVRTIHSYINGSRDDKILKRNLQFLDVDSLTRDVDVFLIDEVQDLTPLLYEAVHKVTINKRIVLVGDKLQCIYGYKDACPQYLENPESWFVSTNKWVYRNMIYSYRLTPSSGLFISKYMNNPGVDEFIGCNTTSPDQKIIYTDFGFDANRACKLILIEIERVGIEEVVIICESVNNISNISPIGKLMNRLADLGIPHFKRDREDRSRSDHEKGKLLVSTIHGMKGREKSVTFVYIDDYYRTMICNSVYESKIPRVSSKVIERHIESQNGNRPMSTSYVAYTRHREKMYIMGATIPLKPIKIRDVYALCDTTHLNRDFIDEEELDYIVVNETPDTITKLLEYRTLDDIINMKSNIEIGKVNQRDSVQMDGYRDITYTGENRGQEVIYKTSVSKYYGIAATIKAEHELCKTQHTIFNIILTYIAMIDVNYSKEHRSEKSEEFVRTYLDKLTVSSSSGIRDKIKNNIYRWHRSDRDDKLFQIALISGIGLELEAEFLPISEYCNKTQKHYLDTEKVNELSLKIVDLFKDCVLELSFEDRYEAVVTHPHIKYLKSTRSYCSPGNAIQFEVSDDITEASRQWLSNYGNFESDGKKYKTDQVHMYTQMNIDIHFRPDATYVSSTVPSQKCRYEFKTCESDKDEHQLQIAAYLSLLGEEIGLLYNLVTGNIYQVSTINRLAFIRALLSKYKYWKELDEASIVDINVVMISKTT